MSENTNNGKSGKISDNGRGQPTKLTPEIQKTICEELRVGSYVETAVVIAGIHRSTFYRWLKRGEEGDPEYVEFCDTVKKAIAEAEIDAVKRIRDAGKNTWQAVAWWLERRFPHKWGRHERPVIDETSPPSEADPQFDPKRLTAVEQDEFLSMMSRFNELTAKGMPKNTNDNGE